MIPLVEFIILRSSPSSKYFAIVIIADKPRAFNESSEQNESIFGQYRLAFYFFVPHKRMPRTVISRPGQGSCVRLNDSVLTFSTASAEQLLIDCVAGFALGNTSDSSIIIVPNDKILCVFTVQEVYFKSDSASALIVGGAGD